MKLLSASTILGLLSVWVIRADAGEKLNSSGQTAGQIADLGEIVEPESSWKDKVRASVTIRGEYTSNAQLQGHHDSSDVILLPTFEIGYTQPINTKLSLDILAKVELGLYADYTEREFIGYSLKSTLDYHPRENMPRFFASVEPYRYDGLDVGEMITQAVGLGLGTSWGRAFNNGHSLFFTGYTFTHYIADPSIDTRNTHQVTAGLSQQFLPNLTGQLVYASQYSDFTDFDRHDSKHIIGVNLIYQISQKWFSTISGSWADNDSDTEEASYQSAGGAVGVTYSF
jgi:Putative beta-barrel porin 2